jgi:hypothetical protein
VPQFALDDTARLLGLEPSDSGLDLLGWKAFDIEAQFTASLEGAAARVSSMRCRSAIHQFNDAVTS